MRERLKTWWRMNQRARRQRELLAQWEAAGRPAAPPDLYKQAVIRRYAEVFGLRTLVETGTYKGYMVAAIKDDFARVFSVELGEDLAAAATRQFAADAHVKILQGDSAARLPDVLSQVYEPTLFWLDAHYSGGVTAKGDESTPIVREIQLLLDHPIGDHVILIDDAMSFTDVSPDYPSVDTVREQIFAARPAWMFHLECNIMRAHPAVADADRLVIERS